MKQRALLLLLVGSLCLTPVFCDAQGSVTLPPSGNNMKSTVIQQLGLAKVKITYNSPDVAGREGQIWGQLVPYGTTDFVAQGFGTATAGPWRAGSNENTTIHFSHDVEVEGKKLAAGTYGLHMIPKEEGAWTLIFSNNHTQWGSYFYDEKEDALRVEVSPEEAPFREYLSYDFDERKTDQATIALRWEKLRVPFSVKVPNMTDLYLANMRRELQSTAGFSWVGFQAAANYCVQQNTNLEEALEWADAAVSRPFIGTKNFGTLQTKAQVLTALNRMDEATEVMHEAMDMGTDMQIYQMGAGLIQQNKNEEAMKVFQTAAKKFPDTWLSHAGLAAGHRVNGDAKTALKHYKIAHEKAPAQWKQGLEARIKQLETAN